MNNNILSRIVLRNNKGYAWENNNGLFYKSDESPVFPSAIDIDNIEILINQITSSFSFVYENEDVIIACVDRIRSMPLFYYFDENNFIITDNTTFLDKEISLELEGEFIDEFKLTGFVTKNNTLVKNLYQIEAGAYLVYNKRTHKCVIKQYFSFEREEYLPEKKESDYFNDLDNLYVNLAKKIKKQVGDKQCVVPLSGGYDSRLILYLLKEAGITNVVCFSYGIKSNYEKNISKKIADLFNFKWIFVEYSEGLWLNTLNSPKIKEYFDFSGNYTSLPHIQDFPAIEFLVSKKIIDYDSYIIPGHSYDFLAGSHLNKKIINKKQFSNEEINKLIFEKHYSLVIQKYDHRKIVNINNEILDNTEAFSIVDEWNWKERQSKFIVNSVRVYEFFDLKWLLPLWDKTLMDFWSKIPMEYCIERNLFKLHFNYRFNNNEEILKDNISFSKKDAIKSLMKKWYFSSILLNTITIIISYTSENYSLFGVVPRKKFIIESILKKKTSINSFLSEYYIKQNKIK
ncbi:asparagine synthase C-terminal domain-containing protein [Flammeovirga kamogawensis]|uniref:asparagine synthase (glutamine-hydrolyzing) n=1 Tax=Flammeovirga kamogawensis TaxID=373891 RepID=A0ABX8GS58_9BACT|nr:asparagine synthase C-terminal domain-containing protein [Flammeovirga kamogawensis]MBB6461527.1 asparagine synthase (glutamine-hydrolyzing) [Flammeovirga kamogawensis]QWG06418.1 asparagine synthase C-terminal domain-containing protein [Flammeovirga kamogawensis]TRX68247.1 asparagine synthase [Flammeovirga kamogawensis]